MTTRINRCSMPGSQLTSERASHGCLRTAYASLEAPEARYITTQGQQFVPGDRSRVLLPMAFCRECGQEYYVVQKHTADDRTAYLPRDLTERPDDEDDQAGFLYMSAEKPWPEDYEEQLASLPEDWLEPTKTGVRVKSHLKKRLPRPLRVNPLGQETDGAPTAWFVPAPFRFCLHCGVAYGGREKSDYGKLATLSSEGRSTATTVLSLSVLRALRRDETLERRARKLLSFTDNRQDASLQSGHFNDFVEVALLRAALYRAVADAGAEGVPHDVLAQRTFEALGLPIELYAVNPEVKFKQRHDTDRALREVLAYRVYRDLRRGWRVTAPNLEQGAATASTATRRSGCVWATTCAPACVSPSGMTAPASARPPSWVGARHSLVDQV